MLYNQKSLDSFAIFESFSNQEKCENKNGFSICKEGDLYKIIFSRYKYRKS